MADDGAKRLTWASAQFGSYRARVKSAGEARDRGDWERAASAFHALWMENRSREALLIQAGNCAKEAGDARGALEAYRTVTQSGERAEAALQLGHLLKITGHPWAAEACYEWAAGKGNAVASVEFEALDVSAPGRFDPRFYLRGGASAGDLLDFVSCMVAAESRPLDCAQLAHAAAAAWAEDMVVEAALFADLTRIVGGPSAGRRDWYARMFPGALSAQAAAPAGAAAQPAFDSEEVVLEQLLLASGAGAPAGDAARADEVSDPWPGDRLWALKSDAPDVTAALTERLRLAAGLRAALWEPDGLAVREAAQAFVDGAGPDRGTLSVSLPDREGAHSQRILAQRVALNCCEALARRLEATLRATQERPTMLWLLFWLPTEVACAAANHRRDRLAPRSPGAENGASDRERRVMRPGLDPEQVDALIFEVAGAPVLPPDRERGALRRLAEQGRALLIEEWLGLADGASVRTDASLMMQLAQKAKQSGDWEVARRLADRALKLRPEDRDFELEAGIISKSLGDFADAAARFRKLLLRRPDDHDAANELDQVAREQFDASEVAELRRELPMFDKVVGDRLWREALRRTGIGDPAKSPSPTRAALAGYGDDRLEVLQIGWLRTREGQTELPRLVGVVSIRARVVSSEPAVGMRVRLDGRTVDHVEPSFAGADGEGRSMFYFNSWINTVDLPHGLVELQLHVQFRSSAYSIFETPVVVDDPRPGEDYPDSDAFVRDIPSTRDLVDAVGALTESVRPANRRAFCRPPQSILVVRLDQLGDVATSLAGMRRLRQLFQDARFEALVTPANEELVKSAGLFDEITTVDFPYDHATRRRHLAMVDEIALRKRYERRPFDLAIDLSPGNDSRPVLKLVKATYRAGFKPRDFDFLDFGIDIVTRDAVNRRENISHTAMINALVEAVGSAAAPPPERFPPLDGSQACLARYGLEPRRYVAIHSGARLEIKRWPLESYVKLARLIREEANLPVAFIADSPLPGELGESLRRDKGVVLFEGRMDFDVLDAVVSHAGAFVGNDTGPKHLAAVRGVFTVSVHMGQVNWNEWGQDGEGCIVSHRAPCCGCGIEDVSECGKAMACLVQIKPRAVANAVLGAFR